jgi:hypothetical protein
MEMFVTSDSQVRHEHYLYVSNTCEKAGRINIKARPTPFSYQFIIIITKIKIITLTTPPPPSNAPTTPP